MAENKQLRDKKGRFIKQQPEGNPVSPEQRIHELESEVTKLKLLCAGLDSFGNYWRDRYLDKCKLMTEKDVSLALAISYIRTLEAMVPWYERILCRKFMRNLHEGMKRLVGVFLK